MKINGIAHIYITVQNFQEVLPFYRQLLSFLQMECLVDTDALYYCVGGRTGIGIRAAEPEYESVTYNQYRAGLHHLCLRAYSKEDVDELYEFLNKANAGNFFNAKIIQAPHESDWAPGYYSVLFEDPGGTRIEMNYVPGKGNLSDEIDLPLSSDRQSGLSEP